MQYMLEWVSYLHIVNYLSQLPQLNKLIWLFLLFCLSGQYLFIIKHLSQLSATLRKLCESNFLYKL